MNAFDTHYAHTPIKELAYHLENHGQRMVQYLSKTLPTPVFSSLSGSHLYGFPSKNSDFDLRGMHIAPAIQVIGIQSGDETITREDYVGLDLQSHDIGKFAKLLAKGNVNAHEQLISQHSVSLLPNQHGQLQRIAQGLYSKKMMSHFKGFAHSEFREFQQDPTLKKFLYTARMLLGGVHFWMNGTLEPNLQALIKIYSNKSNPGWPILAELGHASIGHELEIVRLAILSKTMGHEAGLLPENDFRRHENVLITLFELLADVMEASASKLRDAPTAQAMIDLEGFVISTRFMIWGMNRTGEDEPGRIEVHPG